MLRPITTLRNLVPCLAIVAMLLSGCLSYKPVELVGIRSFKINHVDLKGISATIGAELKNPNGYRIHVLDPDVDLSINGIGIGKAVLDSAVVLPRRSSEVQRIPLRVNFQLDQAGILPGVAMGLLTGTIKLGVKGTVVGKAGLVRKRFPFADERTIDLR